MKISIVDQSFTCPYCHHSFYSSIIPDITLKKDLPEYYDNELKRIYNNITANPITYDIITCKKCYFSLLKNDFKFKELDLSKGFNSKDIINDIVTRIFINIDYNSVNFKPSNYSAILSYLLALECYKYIKSPNIEKLVYSSICTIRIKWILSNIASDFDDEHSINKTKLMINIFYRKTAILYIAILRYCKINKTYGNRYNGPDVLYQFEYLDLLYLTILFNIKCSKVIPKESGNYIFINSIIKEYESIVSTYKKIYNKKVDYLKKHIEQLVIEFKVKSS